jgi:hypothetical protein
MKKLIAVSSLLALVLAGNGLFAVDIPVGDEGGKFTLDLQAEYEVDIRTDDEEAHDNDKTWIEELDADKQGKVSIGASYEGENYAFGIGAGFRQTHAASNESKEWYLDGAWGKYYLLDKQFSIRGGALAGDWGGTIWDTFTGSWSDDKPGFQLAFAPSALTGLTVGLSLPVPKGGTRLIAEDVGETKDTVYGNWGPSYLFANLVFGLRLNQTIPGLDFSTEVKLNGLESTNSKSGADEGEGEFTGADVHVIAKYVFAPVTVQFSLPITGIADARKNAPDPITKLAVRVTFDIPNAEGSSLDLGDPWIQLKMLPNENSYKDVAANAESFKDMAINFEWEPGYNLSDQLKALLWIGVGYTSWAEATTPQKDYPLEFAVRPGLKFTFAPNATLTIQDKVYFARQTKEKGFRNELGFRFAWAF